MGLRATGLRTGFLMVADTRGFTLALGAGGCLLPTRVKVLVVSIMLVITVPAVMAGETLGFGATMAILAVMG
jgi:hypothetical protein